VSSLIAALNGHRQNCIEKLLTTWRYGASQMIFCQHYSIWARFREDRRKCEAAIHRSTFDSTVSDLRNSQSRARLSNLFQYNRQEFNTFTTVALSRWRDQGQLFDGINDRPECGRPQFEPPGKSEDGN
jgi:hypothetical protein